MKNLNAYIVKNVAMSVKDVDTTGRKVKIALSAFGNIDSDSDMILKGAFAKSISERGPQSSSNRQIAFLRYHNWENQIGKFESLTETDKFLEAVGILGNSTKGNDAFLDYQDGIIREHSIGFQYIADKMTYIENPVDPSKNYYEIKEVKLWEGSAVTFGANSLTPVLDVAKGNHTEYLQTLNDEMNGFIKALRNGQGTDERLYSIEMGLKVCQEKYNSLVNMVPFVKSTSTDKTDEIQNNKQSFFKQLTK